MKKLTALLPLPHLADDIDIRSLCLDSRRLEPQALFIALKGHQTDGRQFIGQAIAGGAAAVLAETENQAEHLKMSYNQGVPVVAYYRLATDLSAIAGRFYGQPSEKLALIGVTGTNGKTTVSQLIAQWSQLLGQKAAVMGTVGNGLIGQLKASANTTGSAVDIQAGLAEFVAQGVRTAAIEVSSHGLVQHRADALMFKAAVFTNLTRDHLDYHHSMAAYGAAKKRLFRELNTQFQIINADDDIGKLWLTDFHHAVAVSCRSDFQPDRAKWLKAVDIRFHPQGADIEFQSSWGNGMFRSPLIGAFNVANLLLAAATLLVSGHTLTDLQDSVNQLRGVIGRMEIIKPNVNKAAVIVDYAHTPDALEKALQAARVHCKGKLWCVFGCGGDRDAGKRPLMAKAAQQYADKVIITQDNPRTESQDKIEADIMSGFTQLEKVGVISDRDEAILFAIEAAAADDVIVIAGKGHEDYQIIGNETHHFSDQETALKYLQ